MAKGYSSRFLVDQLSGALMTIDEGHVEVHDGRAFTTVFSRTTAATNGHRSGIYLLTPAAIPFIHIVPGFSASAPADFFLLEAPTIAANIGSHGVAVFNRNRGSANTSLIRDNATVRGVGVVTTLTEAQIAADGTFANGTVIRTGPLTAGNAANSNQTGNGRDLLEFILKANTAYIFMVQNTGANATVHNIILDWYSKDMTF